MYKANENLKELIKKYNAKYMCEEIGITDVFLSYIINGKKSCKKTLAKVLISYCCNISISDSHMNELLNEYFTKEEKED